jgi:hypothetical protein
MKHYIALCLKQRRTCYYDGCIYECDRVVKTIEVDSRSAMKRVVKKMKSEFNEKGFNIYATKSKELITGLGQDRIIW